jgi:WhiB family transcriptional regulator, redox-sensing transcriptional regulator
VTEHDGHLSTTTTITIVSQPRAHRAPAWMACEWALAPGPAHNPADSESEHSMDWRQKAACLDEDPELFFPVGTTGPALEQVERAKQVCRSCAVIEQCLEWALDSNQDAGVWGGLSEDERRTLRRSRQRRRRMAS